MDRRLRRFDPFDVRSERDQGVELLLGFTVAPTFAIGPRGRSDAGPYVHQPIARVRTRKPAPLTLELRHPRTDDAVFCRKNSHAKALDTRLAIREFTRSFFGA